MFNSPIFQPFALMWTADNAKALADGVKGTELPHIMTSQGLDRMTNWTACVWPLILLMVTSKVKYLKTLGWACLPSAIFTIVEPVIFGLPLALNPFLIIPFILTGIVTAIVSYGTFALGFISRFYTTLPWATPPFILGPLGTGDWKSEILVVVSFLIGLIIYYPFFKQFEKHELAKENREIENNTR
ncbi:Putative permease IIC component YwbA [Streptococcus parauberis]|uniref:PTS system cellobiose-specific IIC protein n=1 Tax=Streptococcus parauberis KRS-02083 TaxID=1207545 RepID=A0ABN0IPJ2_9STRE|nr:Putative permease IIC component YwbA [Streptococcus parauberis]EMG24737.1 PTS system cellobiose-specific IIC protein [Streptococcus parauberis KRS-02083]